MSARMGSGGGIGARIAMAVLLLALLAAGVASAAAGGALDPSFGHDGSVIVGGTVMSLAEDPRVGVLYSSYASQPTRRPPAKSPTWSRSTPPGGSTAPLPGAGSGGC